MGRTRAGSRPRSVGQVVPGSIARSRWAARQFRIHGMAFPALSETASRKRPRSWVRLNGVRPHLGVDFLVPVGLGRIWENLGSGWQGAET